MLLAEIVLDTGDTGVCEMDTHPTCGHCRTPPVPLMSIITDMRKVGASGLRNQH